MESCGAFPDIAPVIRKQDVRFDPKTRRGSRIRNWSDRVVPIADTLFACGSFADRAVTYKGAVPARAVRPRERDSVFQNLVLRKPKRLTDRHHVRRQALALGH